MRSMLGSGQGRTADTGVTREVGTKSFCRMVLLQVTGTPNNRVLQKEPSSSRPSLVQC
jgi:hypothetical protein